MDIQMNKIHAKDNLPELTLSQRKLSLILLQRVNLNTLQFLLQISLRTRIAPSAQSPNVRWWEQTAKHHTLMVFLLIVLLHGRSVLSPTTMLDGMIQYVLFAKIKTRKFRSRCKLINFHAQLPRTVHQRKIIVILSQHRLQHQSILVKVNLPKLLLQRRLNLHL